MDNAELQRRVLSRWRSEDGAALVEFALVAPVLFALLLGMISGGVSLARQNSMANAVREGARLGATLQETSAWGSSVRTRVDSLAAGDLSAAQVCVELAVKTSTGEATRQADPASCPFGGEPAMPTAVEEGECVVKVWARRTSELNALFFRRDLTLTADAVAHFERGGTATCD